MICETRWEENTQLTVDVIDANVQVLTEGSRMRQALTLARILVPVQITRTSSVTCCKAVG